MSLTEKDIERLTMVLASKDDVKNLDEKMDSLTELVQGVISANDSLAGGYSFLESEQSAIISQLERIEERIAKMKL